MTRISVELSDLTLTDSEGHAGSVVLHVDEGELTVTGSGGTAIGLRQGDTYTIPTGLVVSAH